MGIFTPAKEKASLGFIQFMRRVSQFVDKKKPDDEDIAYLLEKVNSLTKLFSFADMTRANAYLAEFKKELEKKGEITRKANGNLKKILKELKKEGLLE